MLEDKGNMGICDGCSEEPLVKDWVSCHLVEDEQERKSDVRVSKGSGFHCASLWIPFSPLACETGAESDLTASGGRA